MVIRHSINDWYVNAEGAGDGFSVDWQNDDLPDRGVDSWLDHGHSSRGSTPATQRTQPVAAPARQAGASVKRKAKPTAAPSRQAKASVAARARPAMSSGRPADGRISDESIAVAAATFRAGDPKVSSRMIATALRSRGGVWAGVTAQDVTRALAGKSRRGQSAKGRVVKPAITPGQAQLPSGKGRRAGAEAAGTPGRTSNPGGMRSAGRAGAPDKGRRAGDQRVVSGASWQVFVRAVDSLRHGEGLSTPKLIGRRLGELGWKNVARREIAEAMAERPRESPSVRPTSMTGRAAMMIPVQDAQPTTRRAVAPLIVEPLRPDSGRPLRTPPPVSVDMCPSCAVRVSALGTCRCS